MMPLDNDLNEVKKKELGDLSLHIVFYAKIGSERERSLIHYCTKFPGIN
jgi:hypothetical protein